MLPGLDHMLTQVFRSETGTMFMLCSRRHGLEASVVNLEILDVEILAGYLKLSHLLQATSWGGCRGGSLPLKRISLVYEYEYEATTTFGAEICFVQIVNVGY